MLFYLAKFKLLKFSTDVDNCFQAWDKNVISIPPHYLSATPIQEDSLLVLRKNALFWFEKYIS